MEGSTEVDSHSRFTPRLELELRKPGSTVFRLKSDVPLGGKRVLTVLENAVLKTKLLAFIPRLCECLLEEDPELERVLGSRCSQALVHLVRLQMAWNESKSGRIPPSCWSTILVMEKHPSDKSNNFHHNNVDNSQRKREKTMKKKSLIIEGGSGGGGRRGGKSGERIRTGRHRRQQQADKTNNEATFGRKSHVNTSLPRRMTQRSGSAVDHKNETETRISEERRREETDGHVVGKIKSHVLHGQMEAGERHERVISILQKDVTKRNFLWDLLSWGRDMGRVVEELQGGGGGGRGEIEDQRKEDHQLSLSRHTHRSHQHPHEEEEREEEQVDALSHKKVKTCTSSSSSSSLSCRESRAEGLEKKVHILSLIRTALQSKYGDHVKKALKEKDLKSLFCILTLLADPDTPLTNYGWSQSRSGPDTSHYHHGATGPSQTSPSSSKALLPRPTTESREEKEGKKEEEDGKMKNVREVQKKDHKKTCRHYHHGKIIMESVDNHIKGRSAPLDYYQDEFHQPLPAINSMEEGTYGEREGEMEDFSFAFLFREDHSSDVDSWDSDTNIQSEVWGILRNEMEQLQEEYGEEGEGDVLGGSLENANNLGGNEPIGMAFLMQEDTLDFDSNLVMMDVTDEIETGIEMAAALLTTTNDGPESSTTSPSATGVTCKVVKIPYLSDSSFEDTISSVSELFLTNNVPDNKEVLPPMVEPTSYEQEIKKIVDTSSSKQKGHDEIRGSSPPIKMLQRRPPIQFSTLQELSEELPPPDRKILSLEVKQGKSATIEEMSEPEEEKPSKYRTFLKEEIRNCYRMILKLLVENVPALNWIEAKLKAEGGRVKGVTTSFMAFLSYFHSLDQLMYHRFATSLEEDLICLQKLREVWKNEKRSLYQLKALQDEFKQEKAGLVPQILTLDFQIRILNSRLRKISKEMFLEIKNVVRETELNSAIAIKAEAQKLEKAEKLLLAKEEELLQLKLQIIASEEKLHGDRDELHDLLREEILRYDDTLFKMQSVVDNTIEDTHEHALKVKRIQNAYEDVQSRYIDMCAEKKLKQIMKNMEMADEYRRNKAAKVLQDAWRQYKIRKRKREKRKARRAAAKKQRSGIVGPPPKKKNQETRDSESPPSRQDKSKTPPKPGLPQKK